MSEVETHEIPLDGGWASDNDMISDMAADALLRATDDESPATALEIHGDVSKGLIAFGRRHAWPPAEAFARHAASVGGPQFDRGRWQSDPLYRAGWEAFRAIGAALAPLKLGFDPEPEVKPKAPPRRDPDDDAFERIGGTMERERIDGPRAMAGIRTSEALDWIAPDGTRANPALSGESAGTPLSQVDGIGDGIEKRLMAAGVANVEQLAAMNDVDLDALADRDSKLPDLLRKERFGKPSPIEAARQLVLSRSS